MMDIETKQLIEDEIDAIDAQDWETVYAHPVSAGFVIGELTQALLEIGVNPAEGLGYIPDCYLEDASTLEAFDIPQNCQSIGTSAFRGCTALTHLEIPKVCQAIGNNAFASSSIEELKLPTMKKIAPGICSLCVGLQSVAIAEGTQVIDAFAFMDCYKLEQAAIPTSIVSIEEYAFQNCRAIREVHFPEGLKYLGESAFAYCVSLKSIELPESLDAVGADVFFGCSQLEVLTIKNPKMKVSSRMLFNCDSLKRINFNGTVAQWNAAKHSRSIRSNYSIFVHCLDGDLLEESDA